jgi:hypothetical protein
MAWGNVMKFFWKFVEDAGRWGMASEAAALVSFGLAIWEQDHKAPVFVPLVIAALFFAIGVFTAWRRSARTLEEIETAKPNIKPFLPGATHSIPVSHRFNGKAIDGNDVVIVFTVPFLRVTFWNDPPFSDPKSVAKNLRAYLMFYPVGQSVPSLRIQGRWAESNQPKGDDPYTSTAPLAETTLGLGESNTVDIAFISGLDSSCYAWNNDNYKYLFCQNPAHLLHERGYEVYVRLRGEMVDENFKLTFWLDRDRRKFHFTQAVPTPILEQKEKAPELV